MALGTFWLSRNIDGTATLGVEDYDVGFFDGADYEMTYKMDAENLKKFEAILSQTHEGTLEEMIEEEFGIHLNKKNIREWFEDNGIEFEYFSWMS